MHSEREGQTHIASVTSRGLSEVARLGGESSGGSCEEREEGCEEMHGGSEMVVLMECVGGHEDLGCS